MRGFTGPTGMFLANIKSSGSDGYQKLGNYTEIIPGEVTIPFTTEAAYHRLTEGRISFNAKPGERYVIYAWCGEYPSVWILQV